MATPTPTPTGPSPPPARSPLSIDRLTAAFAQMLGSPASRHRGATPLPPPHAAPVQAGPDPLEISPRSIVEGVLFVGAEGGRPRPAHELAALMRDVSPAEVDRAVDDLNAGYARDGSPYAITRTAAGYQLELLPEWVRVREKLAGRARVAGLSPAALEALSVIAYRQPVTQQQVDQLRGSSSRGLVALLVRHGLVRLERRPDGVAAYRTTDRFLKQFGLPGIEGLPRAAELDD